MSDSESLEIAATIVISILAVGAALAFLALIVALTNRGDVIEGITGHDLHMAFIRCKPVGATFEQTLACTQAIYGGGK